MRSIGDAIQEKCMAFGDRVIKLNDYLLSKACKMEEERWKKSDGRGKVFGGIRIPIYLKSVANLSNQLLRAGTSIGANNAEATNAISKADFKSKSFSTKGSPRKPLLDRHASP